jgi:hypothetical protein
VDGGQIKDRADGQSGVGAIIGFMELTDDQRRHLDYIQAVITRLATSSSALKGWGLTVAVATFGLSTANTVPLMAILGLVTVLFFALLDSQHLRQERLFRELYEDARTGKVEIYSMDKNAYRNRCTHGAVIRSWSVAGFYGPLGLVGVLTLIGTL